MPSYDPGPTPEYKKNDVSNVSPSKQVYKTPGVSVKSQSFKFRGVSLANWNSFIAWFASTDNANNFIFIQHEGDLISLPPYYATFEDYKTDARDRLLIDYSIDIQEAK